MNETLPVSPPPEASAPAPVLRIRRLLAVVVPLAVVVTAAALGWGYFDVPALIANWRMPPLTPVSGQVLFNDQPLAEAEVLTQPENPKLRGAIGVTDADGRFVLKTDVNGKFETGAFVGSHRVTVAKRDNSKPVGPAPLPLLTPAQYSQFDKTPLEIQVARVPLDRVVFRLEGAVEPPKVGLPEGMKMPPGPPGRGTARKGGKDAGSSGEPREDDKSSQKN